MKTFVKFFKSNEKSETPYWAIFGVLISLIFVVFFSSKANSQNPSKDLKKIYQIVKKEHTSTYIRNGNLWDTCYVFEKGDDKIEISKNVLIMRQNKGAKNFYSYDLGNDGKVEVVVVTPGPLFPSEEFSLKLVGLGAYEALETQLYLSSRLDQDKSEAYQNRCIFILPISEVYDFQEKEIFNLPNEFKDELNFFYRNSIKEQLAKLKN